MIDFRYHLVSIIAVFLALAIGIVLGTTVLRGPVMQRVQHAADKLQGENQQLRGQVKSLRQQVEADQQLVRDVAPSVLDGSLQGERVTLVEAPGASDELRIQLTGQLEQAGATVTRHIQIQRSYLGDGEKEVVGRLATRLKPSGVSLSGSSAYERAGAVLGSALMTSAPEGRKSPSRTQRRTALSGFSTGGYLTTGDEAGKPAGLAVLIAPASPFEGDKAASDNAALVTLARELDQRGRAAVVAGPTAATREGGLVRALRGSGAAAQEVSTVDFAGTATGRVATVAALAQDAQQEQAEQGAASEAEPGHYGVGPGARAYLPSLGSLEAASPDSSGSAGP